MLNNDDGSPVQIPWFGDKCIHVKGTFGVGGTCKVQGTNDGAVASVFGALTVCLLRDPGGTALSFTAEDLKQILETPVWVRPIITGGDGTTSLTAIISCRPPSRSF